MPQMWQSLLAPLVRVPVACLSPPILCMHLKVCLRSVTLPMASVVNEMKLKMELSKDHVIIPVLHKYMYMECFACSIHFHMYKCGGCCWSTLLYLHHLLHT